ncbi:MAG TPA: NUDIX domain-containing protein [Pyrinomonadaceae bacterium]|nr:NUDIX domain-containing protein [Pyrinomonadaceae bacterium]
MLTKIFGGIFRFIPGALRRRIVRLGQHRFTVTAGALVFDDENRILLLEHVFRPDSRWGIPGGFLNKGEQPDVAVRRELKEEVNLDVSDVQFLFARTLPRPRQVEIYFRCKPNGVPSPSSFEITKAGWFGIDDLPPDLSEDQRRIIKRALEVRKTSGG